MYKLHNKALSIHRKNVNEGIIRKDAVKPEIKHFNKYTKINTNTVVEDLNYNAYVLESNDRKYLLEAIRTSHSNPLKSDYRINLDKVFPIRVNNSEPVAFRNTVYDRITSYNSVRVVPEKTMSFRALVDALSGLGHTHPKHFKLYWLTILASVYNETFLRIATTPGFGKDGVIETLKLLTDKTRILNSAKVSSAKIEREIQNPLIAFDEISKVEPQQWTMLEEFLKPLLDGRQTTTKSKRAYKGVGEEIDSSNNSIIFLYNNKHEYKNGDYYDDRADDATQDRILPLQLKGKVRDQRLIIDPQTDIEKEAEENQAYYRELQKNLKYYEEHQEPGFETSIDFKAEYGQRWNQSRSAIIRVLAMYSENQQELREWVSLLDESKKEYDRMVLHGDIRRATLEKFNETEQNKILKTLRQAQTFKEKNSVIHALQNGGNKTL